MNQLDAADRARTLSDLESREEHVARKEQVLSDAQERLNSIESQIAIKSGLLEAINDKLVKANENLQNIADKQARSLTIFKSDEADLVRSIDKLLEDKTKLNESLGVKRKELKELNVAIAERKKYLDDQESMIDESVAIGVDRLRELRGEVSSIENNQDMLVRDIVRHEQVRDENARMIDIETDKLDQLKQTYQQKAAEYRVSLKQLSIDLEAQRQEHAESVIRFTAREQALKGREQAVVIKSDELDQEQLKLNQRIRKFESDKAVHSV